MLGNNERNVGKRKLILKISRPQSKTSQSLQIIFKNGSPITDCSEKLAQKRVLLAKLQQTADEHIFFVQEINCKIFSANPSVKWHIVCILYK